jgi:WD40 repeat protein
MVDFKESLPSLPLFSTHGQLILTLGPGSNAAIWNPVTGRKVTAISDSARVLSGAFDPAGDLAVTGTLDGISVWKTQTGESLYSRSCTNVQSVRFTADSAYAVGVGSDRIVRIQLATGQTTESVIPGRTNDVRDSVSENGLFVLRRGHIRQDSFADQDMGKSARVYEAATGRQVCYVPPEEPDGVEHTSVWLSSQGTYLATVDRSNRILVRNTSNCREASQVQLGSDIAAFTFEPDEKYFATLTEDDRALRVWDLASGREISRRILATEPYYKYISFSPDGIFLASIESVETATGLPGKVRMWGWRPEDAAAAACERLTSNLSTTEWVRYFQGEPYRKTCDNLALPK